MTQPINPSSQDPRPHAENPPSLAAAGERDPQHSLRWSLLSVLAFAAGCATPPSGEQLARLPTVEFPNPPPPGEFILKLPAGKPIPLRVAVKGSLLTKNVEQTLTTSIAKDLYLYKTWASEDGKTWCPGTSLVGVDMTLALPSDAHPKPGELVLELSRKAAR